MYHATSFAVCFITSQGMYNVKSYSFTCGKRPRHYLVAFREQGFLMQLRLCMSSSFFVQEVMDNNPFQIGLERYIFMTILHVLWNLNSLLFLLYCSYFSGEVFFIHISEGETKVTAKTLLSLLLFPAPTSVNKLL